MGKSQRTNRDDESGALDADLRTIDELLAGGADLNRERPVRHYVVCANRSDAGTATLQLREAGFDASAFENPTAAGWIVVAVRTEIVDADSIQLSRSHLELIASRFPGSVYDGWKAEFLADEASTRSGRAPAQTGF